MTRTIFFLSGIIIMSACNLKDKSSHPDTDNFQLTWEFRGNDPGRGISSSVFILENYDNQVLGEDNWELYFNQMGVGILQESVTGNVRIDHVNGDLLRISPLKDFVLPPGESVEISYEKTGRLIKETEAPAGPYFVFGSSGEGPEETFAVEHYTVRPFPGLERIFPSETGIPLPDAGWVFEQNLHQQWMEPSKTGRIIPTPDHILYSGETESLDNQVKIHYQRGQKSESEYLGVMLETLFGVRPKSEVSDSPGENIILLSWVKEGTGRNWEGYELSIVSGEGITITGTTSTGIFHGIQSLLALFPVSAWVTPQERVEIECVNITDIPAFMYRGIMLDIARNYHPPEDIKKLIRVMGFYKMNRLHLSLTNDEAWRLEIPSLPELTEVGGFRGHTRDSKDHLIPVYGSGPYPDPKNGVGSGYLSREEFMDILKFASQHHIEVIPEINFPGHARAAIYAMEARYDRLVAEGNPEEADKYRLIDPEDSSVYNSAQNFNDNVVCVCKEAPFLFFETVVDEVAAMYRDAGLELRMVHTGGDEVPAGAWSGSPVCNTLLESETEPGSVQGLQIYFESRLLDILSRKNLVMAGWEEIALKKDNGERWNPNPDFAGKGMVPYIWNSLGDYLDLGNRVANAGFPVILCNVDNFYFDLAYNHHPAEPGHFWGGFVDTRRAYEFIPFNVFYSTLTDQYRRPYGNELNFEKMEALRPEARKNILGLQGQLWSETIKGGEMLEYYYLPKLMGLAERAWAGQAEWGEIRESGPRIEAIDRSWNKFANVIGQRELPRLDYLFGGYNYRLPPPGAVVRNGLLYANIDFPGLVIRYTMDGSEPDMDSPVYKRPAEVTGEISLRSFDTRGRGSRVSVPRVN